MKKNSNYMIFILLFYVVVAFFAFAFLSGDYSIFNRKPVTTEQPMAETVVGNNNATEEISEEPVKEETVEEEPIEEKVEEEPEEETVEEENVVEEPVEEETAEEEAEETPVIEEVEEKEEIVYYSFDTNHTKNKLRVRDKASLDGKVLEKLPLHSSGYVLEYDSEWCKVVTSSDTVGYCSTEYLNLTEVDESDFPEEYRDKVTTTRVNNLIGDADESEASLEKSSADVDESASVDKTTSGAENEENMSDTEDSAEDVLDTDEKEETTSNSIGE